MSSLLVRRLSYKWSDVPALFAAALISVSPTTAVAAPSGGSDKAAMQRVCGHVVPECGLEDKSGGMVLTIDPATIVIIEVENKTELPALRAKAASMPFLKVCMDAREKRAAKRFREARYAISSPSAVIAQETQPAPDWAYPDAASRCVEDVIPPKPLKKVPPTYPAEALKAGIEGVVAILGVVSADGKFGDMRIIGSVQGLDIPALDAVRRWTFSPAEKDGKAVPSVITVGVEFRVQ